MTQNDFAAFRIEYERMAAGLQRFKISPEEASKKLDVYFHVLKKFSLQDVQIKASRWLEKETKFPSAAEWAGVVSIRAVELALMTPAEWAEHMHAEQLGYEGECCECVLCVRAGVNEKPLRYVPTLDRDERTIQRLDPSGKKPVTVGHWAHGGELAGYYRAVADFWETAYRLFPQTPKGKRLSEALGSMARAV